MLNQVHGINRDGFTTFFIEEHTLELAIAEVEKINPFSARLVNWVNGKKRFVMKRDNEGFWTKIAG
jgi:hypothetical protein